MTFDNKISKFGKGEKLTAYMPDESTIYIYYFLGGLQLKKVHIGQSLTLSREKLNLGYKQIIRLDNQFIVTAIDRSLGIKNEQD